MKKWVAHILVVSLLAGICFLPFPENRAYADNRIETADEEKLDFVEELAETVSGETLDLTCKSAILMEAGSGSVIYDLNGSEQLSPASITKIMTLLLIFDAIHDGSITLEDEVTTSAYAKSMGGSQVFLEEGEKQTVDTLIKCIVVASGNDASVAMAEYIAGSEEAFVAKMNDKAKELGMDGTHFEDCCGLTDSDNHYTTALDVAKMARALIVNYPQIEKYSTIWMENITHVTNKGSSEFGLSNTNKLLKMGTSFKVTGLKTGSTAKAKYCFCGTAVQNDISLIAVIMAAPDYKVRFSQAKALLDYGYANCRIYKDDLSENEFSARIQKGTAEMISGVAAGFSYVTTDGTNPEEITKKIVYDESLQAPVKRGERIGEIQYFLKDKQVGVTEILAAESVEKADFKWYIKKIGNLFFGT